MKVTLREFNGALLALESVPKQMESHPNLYKALKEIVATMLEKKVFELDIDDWEAEIVKNCSATYSMWKSHDRR